MLMVKPGMPYLDLVREVKDKVSSPLPLPWERAVAVGACPPF